MNTEHDRLNNAEMHRRLSESVHKLGLHNKLKERPNIKAEDVQKILQLGIEVGPKGQELISHLAKNSIGPEDVTIDIHDVADKVYRKLHPPTEPITIITKSKPLGFIPFGGTISEKTIYDTSIEPQPLSGENVITIERTSFGKRLINKILNRH
jgi:hypothetical protein